jgi:predicted DNA-binding transcriptional regulator AlpA
MGTIKTKLLSGTAPRKEPAAPATDENTKPVNAGMDVRASEPPEAVTEQPLRRRGRPQKPRGPPPASGQPRKFLNYDDLVARCIGLSRVHLRRLSIEGHFPAAVKLGSDACQTSVVWLLEEVEAWEQACIARRDAKVAVRRATAK